VYEEASALKRAAVLWADDRSLFEYVGQVKWRALGDYAALAPPDSEESYFPSSIFSLSPDEDFVDCGAYDGDTLRALIDRQQDRFRHFSAFEPDPANYAKLQQFVTTLPPTLRSKISLHSLAVGATRSRLTFNATGTEGAAIDDRGGITVQCALLDDVMSNRPPTYLKMDIEGSERNAIVGARSTIQQYQPVMAVCVYHKQNDLWQLPLFIHSLQPDYRFFLRTHDVDGWQTVCYAVPKARCRRA
jgi:FkbM family methyltransferase